MSASRGPNRDECAMTGDGEAPGGSGRVVDLRHELCTPTEPRNNKAFPEAEEPGGTNVAAFSRATRCHPSQLGTAVRVGVYAKSSTRLPDGSVDYNYASTRVMCATDGLALVRVSGEIDHCTAPKLTAAVNEALSKAAGSIYVDLAEVTFFSAAGAVALLTARRHCQRRRVEFVILRPSRPALKVLAFTDLLRPVIDLREKRLHGDGPHSW